MAWYILSLDMLDHRKLAEDGQVSRSGSISLCDATAVNMWPSSLPSYLLLAASMLLTHSRYAPVY